MSIRKGFIDVRLGSGSGKTYTERDFQGSGVSGFDATRGATVNSTLTDMTAAGTAKGTIGAVSSISGTVDCGNQHPGSGEITVTGDTGDGVVSGNVTSLLVRCDTTATGQNDLVLGLTHVGAAPAFVEIGGGAGTGTITLFVALQTATGSHFYSTTTPGTQSFSTGHITYKGTATEAAAAGGAPHSVAVAGNATCGT
jgi:hypothetical protein